MPREIHFRFPSYVSRTDRDVRAAGVFCAPIPHSSIRKRHTQLINKRLLLFPLRVRKQQERFFGIYYSARAKLKLIVTSRLILDGQINNT